MKNLCKVSCQVLLILSLGLFGCRGNFFPSGLYVHSETRAKLSKEAKEIFDSTRGGSNNVFDEMLRNLAQSDKQWKESTDVVTKVKNDAFIIAAPGYTWETILQKGTKTKCDKMPTFTIVSCLENQIQKQNNETTESLKIAREKLSYATKNSQIKTGEVGALKTELTKLKSKYSEYNQNVQKFRDAIKNLSKDETVATQEPSAGKERESQALISAADDLMLVLNPETGPGIKVTVLSLAIDLAESERDRIAIEIKYLNKLIQNGQKQTKLFDSATKIFAQLAEDKEDIGNYVRNYSQQDEVIQSVLKIIDDYASASTPKNRLNEFSNLQSVLEIIGRIAILESIHLPELKELQMEAYSIAHGYSIHRSKINARAREAIISRGLEGLSIYHEGGVRPEEIAKFIYAAGIIASIGATN